MTIGFTASKFKTLRMTFGSDVRGGKRCVPPAELPITGKAPKPTATAIAMLIDFVLSILFQLKDLPGFRFVGPYYYSILSKTQAVLDKKGDMEELVGGAATGVRVLKNSPKAAMNAKGSKKRN